jgi:signal transduction histidine kinase
MSVNVKLGIFFIFLILSKNARAQQSTSDSLKKILQNHPKPDTNRVKILNNLAFSYYNDNNWDAVKNYSEEAIALSRQLKYLPGEGYAYRRLSTVYMQDNANPLALEYLNKAYKIFKLSNDELNCARILTNMGVYYHDLKDYKLSMSYFSQALQFARKLNRASLEIVLLNNIGDINERTGEIGKAHASYCEALALALKTKDDDYLPFCYANLASVFLKEKKYKTALDYCNKVIATQKAKGNIEAKDLAEIYLTQERIYFALKNYDKARETLIQSDLLTKKTRDVDDRVQIYYEYYVLDSAKKDYGAALHAYSMYNKLNDSLINMNKNKIVALYNVKFESQKREDENQRLRLAGEKNQVIINNQHIILAGLVIGIIVICCGLIYFKHINNKVKAQNKIINEQNMVLENSNMVKDKLFSVISHDLRSPITQVVSMLTLWQAGDLDSKEMAEITPVIKSGIINTLELLDNLLIWSKNQLQGFNFNPLPFDAHELIAENINDLQNHIAQKKLFVNNFVPADTRVFADREMVKIVLRNLMSNAIKFTPHGGSININSNIENDKIILSVEDTGMGVKDADKDKIFAFTTHTTLGTANEKGTGIGLRICRDFIEINKGKIWMKSQENVGSKFYISFPNAV